MQTNTLERPVRRNHRLRPSYETALATPAHAPAPEQETLALLLAHGRDVLCTLDATGHCHRASGNWESISGCGAAQERGGSFRDRIAPDHLRRVLGCLAAGDTHANPIRFQIRHKDGQWRWCEMQVLQSRQEGEVAHYTCILRNVNDVVMTQGKLEKARLEADLANKSRSEFLANMSHELRTPLNAILGFAQMIEGGTYGDVGHPKYHSYIGNIAQSGNTLLSKINDLLEIANIDSGRMELNESPADLGDVLRQAIEFHSHRAFSAQITLRDQLPREPVWVMVDRIRMLQVVTNLLSNAIKYNRSGGTVDISCALRRDGSVDILIEDNGGGIQANHLSNILDAFGQDNSFFARSRDCVGLGLALSKEIVKLHQGRIHIESEPGKGTLLAIRLPKERRAPAPLANPVETCRIAAVS